MLKTENKNIKLKLFRLMIKNFAKLKYDFVNVKSTLVSLAQSALPKVYRFGGGLSFIHKKYL